MDERERFSLRYLIESTWLLLGGPASLCEETDIDDTQAFFSLLDDLTQSNVIVDLDKLKEQINQLYAPSQQDSTAVQIMTIHTAKGLEFDTVILPHLERKLPNSDKELLSWMERPLCNDHVALLLAPIQATGRDKETLYEYIQRQQRIKLDYESDRLFYVATTRAKKNLLLFFNLSQNDKGDYRIESGSFLEKLWPHIEHQINTYIISQTNTDTATISSDKEHVLQRFPITWQNPYQTDAIIKSTLHQKQHGFQITNMQPKLIGIVLHRMLQLIGEQSINWWQTESQESQIVYLTTRFKQLGLATTQLNDAIQFTLKSIQQVLADERGLWILHPHRDARSEWALSAQINGQIENMIIDRTFIDEHGTRWIIDYKTTAFRPEDKEDFLKNEQDKYLNQMHKYAYALNYLEKRPTRLGLYFPAIIGWLEWSISDNITI